MAIPFKITGAGNNSTAQNVLKVTFSQALSSVPRLEAWDDGNLNTVTGTVFTGTSGNGNIPMLAAVATTDTAPSSSWKPASPTAGGATANRLKGSTNYVNLSASAPGAGGAVRFNVVLEVPSDISAPATLNWVLAVRYWYTGTAPTLTWAGNEGTEGSPTWTSITAGASGNYLRPADQSTGTTWTVDKPTSGTKDAPYYWITT